MKKWMILAAAILVVLGIGFAVKGASDKKQGATPEGTAVPETTTSAQNEETETANALREETETTETTETEDGAEEIDTLCGQITEINDEYLILEGTQQGTVQVNIFDDTLYNAPAGRAGRRPVCRGDLRRQDDALHPRADCGAGDQCLSAEGHGGRGGGGRPRTRDPGGRRRAGGALLAGRRDAGSGRNRDLLHQRHGYHVHPGADERHRRGEVSEN